VGTATPYGVSGYLTRMVVQPARLQIVQTDDHPRHCTKIAPFAPDSMHDLRDFPYTPTGRLRKTLANSK